MSVEIDEHFFQTLATEIKLDYLENFTAPRLSMAERLTAGKALREKTPRSEHARLPPRRRSMHPLPIIEAQNATRYQPLVPVRWARMLASPFGFLRGAAAVMAADLAATPSTGLDVMACGDMHLLNFGLFASAERNLVFAINDFDETHPGPWEWDLKRLATSAAVAAAYCGGDRIAAQAAAHAAVETYVRRMRLYAELGYLATWYDLIDEQSILAAAPPHARRSIHLIMDKAHAKGHMRALDRMTAEIDGEHRILEEPPLIVRETHLPNGTPINVAVDLLLRSYIASLPDDRVRLLSRYRIVDIARKVVGVGSVGTSCWVVLFEGLDSGDPLFLQVKEATPSVLAPHVKVKLPFSNQGQRVVYGQRMIQGSPDIFLGWGPAEGVTALRQFYVRQLADMKGGISLIENDPDSRENLENYARLCGWALALAHAKSGDAALISGYCGKGAALPDAISEFALAYMEQNARDHAALEAAALKGKITVASATEAGLG